MSQVVQSEVVNEFIKSKNDFSGKNREELIKENLSNLQHYKMTLKERFLDPSLFILPLTNFALIFFYFLSDSKINYPIAIGVLNLFVVLLIVLVDIGNRSNAKFLLKQLKQLLESTHYETRISFVSYFSSTLKIVVEGNLDINGLVIKESSKHFTSYVEAANPVELVKNLVKIIEKQEKMFKVKE